MKNTKYDSIIIGSGAGGLTTAICLAMNGQKVLVLERHYVPGGWCHSFMLNGQKFSPGVHYIGDCGENGSTRKMFEDLEIANELVFFKMKEDGFEHARIGDTTFDYPSNKEALKKRLIEQFPLEKKGICNYLKLVGQTQIFLSELLNAERPWAKFKLYLRSLKVLRFAFSNLDNVINRFIKNAELKAILNVQWGNHGVLPKDASFLYHCGVNSHYSNGGYYPMGGGSALVKAMTNTFKKYGGEIKTGVEVSEILVENNKAIGVQIKGGEKFFAENIVSNADPHVTFNRLIGSTKISSKLKKKLAKTKYSYASFLMFITLDIDPSKYDLDSGNYWTSKNSDFNSHVNNDSLEELLKLEKFPMAFISSSTLKDPVSFDGKHINIELVTFAEQGLFDKVEEMDTLEYDRIKKRISEMFLNNLEVLIPNVREHIVQMEIGTPKTNQRYINSTGGNVYGIHKTFDQLRTGAFGPQSEIQNLYLCGSSSRSHGVAGSMNSGIDVARVVLDKSRSELFSGLTDQNLRVFNAEDPTSFSEFVKSKGDTREKRMKTIPAHSFLEHKDPKSDKKAG
ncbi:MAG: NAD(P)/FAD-dependent oxidoreductase [Crocinitomicaceae bacterium]|nr:NAD(P)/FAD-dependent oxidoreductase [Crocinitomicaceae bacterium]